MDLVAGTFYDPGSPADPDAEIFLPLSPEIGFLATRKHKEGYAMAPADVVNELDRRTRAYSERVIVASSDHMEPYWFIDVSRERKRRLFDG